MTGNVTFGRRVKVISKRYGRVIIGGVILFVILALSFSAPLLTKENYLRVDVRNKYQPADSVHKLGTDSLGRDVFARLLYGAQYSISIAIVVQVLTVGIGAFLGLLCGFYKTFDKIVMRILEAIHALPTILLVFVISSVLGQGVGNMITALVIGSLTQVVRQVRAQVLSLKQKEFIEREIAIGSSDFRIMIKHILPHCTSFLFVRLGSGIGSTILSMSTLAYLGVGLPPEIPTWGGDISLAQAYIMVYPHLVFCPMIAIAATVFACSMLGDGLRDILDPTLR